MGIDPVTSIFNFLTELVKTSQGQQLLGQLVSINGNIVNVLNDFIMHIHGQLPKSAAGSPPAKP